MAASTANMMQNLTDDELVRLINSRMSKAKELNSLITQYYDKNKERYRNNPKWSKTKSGRSNVRVNRDFDNMESVMSFFIAQISKPNVIPASKTEDSRKLANDLQTILVEKNKERKTKKMRKRMARNGFFSRLFILKIFWNNELEAGKGDWDIKNVDPRTIYIDPDATSCKDAESIIEEVKTTFKKLIARFPNKEKEIREKIGDGDKVNADIANPELIYHECWLDYGKWVCYKFQGEILDNEQNPYYDWDGIPFSSDVDLKGLGRRRKDVLNQEYLTDEVIGKMETDPNYTGLGDAQVADTQYLFNHFTEPRAPYIFSTIFDTEDSPIGITDYFSQTATLSEDIDKTKRLIVDNAQFVNGCTIVSGATTGLTEAEAERIDWSRGVLYISGGDTNGVRRETGASLPPIVMENLQHSERANERIWGSLPVFKGESERQMTALEARMLKDQTIMTKQEIVDLVEEIDEEMYNWQLQMMKCKYIEDHLVRYLGENNAVNDIEISREDIEDGISVKVIKGSTVPEDRLFKQQEAKELFLAGLIDILTYYEADGEDKARDRAKQAMLFKLNPQAYAVQYLGMTPQEMMQGVPEVNPEKFEKDLIEQAEVIESNPDLNPDEKMQMIERMKQGLGATGIQPPDQQQVY